jgi:hypothetical protein
VLGHLPECQLPNNGRFEHSQRLEDGDLDVPDIGTRTIFPRTSLGGENQMDRWRCQWHGIYGLVRFPLAPIAVAVANQTDCDKTETSDSR